MVRRLYRRVGIAADRALFDWRLDVDTSGVLSLPEHGQEDQPYEAVRWLVIGRLLRNLKLTDDDVLLDAGCGKGRVLLQAARTAPLKRIVGFDISEKLVQTARRNVDATRGKLKCQNVDLVVADATRWPIPDDVTVIVANNPFSGEVFERFLDQVLASTARHRRRVRFLYVWPWCRGEIERTGRFVLCWSHEASAWGPAACLYEVA